MGNSRASRGVFPCEKKVLVRSLPFFPYRVGLSSRKRKAPRVGGKGAAARSPSYYPTEDDRVRRSYDYPCSPFPPVEGTTPSPSSPSSRSLFPSSRFPSSRRGTASSPCNYGCVRGRRSRFLSSIKRIFRLPPKPPRPASPPDSRAGPERLSKGGAGCRWKTTVGSRRIRLVWNDLAYALGLTGSIWTTEHQDICWVSAFSQT